ncbi:MAG: hypothetical protein IKS87_05790 [Lachnospiraceae bacterium]|nr:hypothetical protein [Lachnospiraceae bacterium]
MKIWAHRGCSQCYPENTLLAFEKAAAIPGLCGIELDIQLTRDGEIVVCHDERVDRTTSGIGFVRDHSLEELSRLVIGASDGSVWKIPTMAEVLDLLEAPMKKGLKLNIELKNSVFPYPGMEEKIIGMVHERGLQEQVVYSSFYAKSLELVRKLDPETEIGMLDTKVSDCLYKLKGGSGANALHPYWKGIDLTAEELKDYTVRAWFSGHLYPEKPNGNRLDLAKLEAQGITDVFLNEPEVYL